MKQKKLTIKPSATYSITIGGKTMTFLSEDDFLKRYLQGREMIKHIKNFYSDKKIKVTEEEIINQLL